MAEQYRIVLAPSASKELEDLPAGTVERIVKKIDGLAENPRPPGAIKLTGIPSWRVRIGDFRVIYSIDDRTKTVRVDGIRHRSKAYRRL